MVYNALKHDLFRNLITRLKYQHFMSIRNTKYLMEVYYILYGLGYKALFIKLRQV